MAAVEIESRGTRSEIKEQSENIKSLGGRFFLYTPLKLKIKAIKDGERREKD